MLVVRQELHHPRLLRLLMDSRSTLVCDLEVNTVARARVDTAHLPCASIPNSTFGFADGGGFLVERHGMPDEPSDLELLCCQYLKNSIKAHQEVVVAVLLEYAYKRLLEHGRCETVGEDHMATGGIAEALHFKEANLIKAASKYVDYVAIVGSSFREVIIKLSRVSKMTWPRQLVFEQGIDTFSAFL